MSLAKAMPRPTRTCPTTAAMHGHEPEAVDEAQDASDDDDEDHEETEVTVETVVEVAVDEE